MTQRITPEDYRLNQQNQQGIPDQGYEIPQQNQYQDIQPVTYPSTMTDIDIIRSIIIGALLMLIGIIVGSLIVYYTLK